MSIKRRLRWATLTSLLRALGIACLAPRGGRRDDAGRRSPSTIRICPARPLRLGLAAAFVLGTLGAFLFLRNRRRTLVGFAVAFAAVLLWWTSIEPSNERDWQTDVAVLPYATRDGDLVTLHNVRNFDYRTATRTSRRATTIAPSICASWMRSI